MIYSTSKAFTLTPSILIFGVVMSMLRKSHLVETIASLDSFYRELQTILTGDPANASAAHRFGFEDGEKFAEQYVSVDLQRLTKVVSHFKVEIDALKQLKSRALPPLR